MCVYTHPTLSSSPSDEIPSCRGSWNIPGQPGVFYQTTGTGGTLRATVLILESTLPGPVIQIFVGDCNNLVCVGEPFEEKFLFDAGPLSSYQWLSVPGETYFIHVTGGVIGENGDFGFQLLEVEEEEKNLSGNGCDEALPLILSAPNIIIGTEKQVANDKNAPACSRSNNKGVWYSIDAPAEVS